MTKILVCDDSDLFRAYLCLLLTDLGFTCDGAGSCEEALRYLDSNRYDAVTIDLIMPVQSGQALITECMKRGIPVVVVTGLAEDHARQYCPDAVPVFTKPFDLWALEATLRDQTSQHRARVC